MKTKFMKFIIVYFITIYIVTTCIPLFYIYFFKDNKKEVSEQVSTPETFQPAITVNSTEVLDSFILYDYSTKQTTKLNYRDFLIGSLAYEMDVSVPMEALKAQTVATFSYYLYIQSQNKSYDVLWDSLSGYNYYNTDFLKEYWQEDYDKNIEIIETAVDSVYGEFIMYDGAVACAAYFPVSNGQTESAEAVWGQKYEYLCSVASPNDKLSSSFTNKISYSPDEIKDILTKAWENAKMDFTIDYDKWFDNFSFGINEAVKSLTVCTYGVTGQELKTALSLPSTTFKVDYIDEKFVFTCKGQGDGVGMSQTGAIYMANEKADYKEILLWYFPGTMICK